MLVVQTLFFISEDMGDESYDHQLSDTCVLDILNILPADALVVYASRASAGITLTQQQINCSVCMQLMFLLALEGTLHV